ncbi:MAG TPA: Gfo/Idh/MocA family oxidoreductase [Thermomicrobiales bacterium]|nr:Gfo/Idh/MocA family oxidoreductase [Thermomicrobiales bacterium]
MPTDTVRVGLVGYKFMGRAHSNAYRQVHAFFPEVPKPEMVAIAGRNEEAVRAAAEQLGWEEYETDYHALVRRDDIDLVDVVTPGYLHHDVVIAALESGKHVYCEKPLANTLPEAADMVRAWRKAGTISMVNFNYRRVPAVQLAKRLIEQGRLGDIRHIRAVYLQDWLLDPSAPLSWRLKKEFAGSGALGDIGAHITDLARFLIGEFTGVTGTLNTYIKQRPVEVESTGGSGLSMQGGDEMGDVTVDDCTSFLARFDTGATGVFEATRLAPGRRNYNSFEINGSLGSVVFNLERLNELQVYFVDDAADVQGFRTVNVTDPSHPYVGNWWPGGHIIGWEHSHIHTVRDLLEGIAKGENPAPSFEDGYRCQAVLDAVERSAASGQWETPEELPE